MPTSNTPERVADEWADEHEDLDADIELEEE